MGALQECETETGKYAYERLQAAADSVGMAVARTSDARAENGQGRRASEGSARCDAEPAALGW